MKKDKILIESMTKFYSMVGDLHIRIWRQEEKEQEIYGNGDLKDFVYDYLDKYNKNDNIQIAKDILKFDRVNAVEVVKEHGNGVVLYRNWP